MSEVISVTCPMLAAGTYGPSAYPVLCFSIPSDHTVISGSWDAPIITAIAIAARKNCNQRVSWGNGPQYIEVRGCVTAFGFKYVIGDAVSTHEFTLSTAACVNAFDSAERQVTEWCAKRNRLVLEHISATPLGSVNGRSSVFDYKLAAVLYKHLGNEQATTIVMDVIKAIGPVIGNVLSVLDNHMVHCPATRFILAEYKARFAKA